MNAKQRKQDRRVRELVKLGRGEATAAKRVVELEHEVARLTGENRLYAETLAQMINDREEARSELKAEQETRAAAEAGELALVKQVVDRGSGLEVANKMLQASNAELRATVSERDRTIASIREEERDARQLRHRLQRKTEALDECVEKINKLEAELRAAHAGPLAVGLRAAGGGQ